MAAGWKSSSESADEEIQERELDTYGVFAESDSDDHVDEDDVRFVQHRGFTSGRSRLKRDSTSRTKSSDTQFVKGGTLMLEAKGSKTNNDGRQRCIIYSGSNDDADSDMEVISELSETDLLDRILADEHLEYSKEGCRQVFNHNDDEMATLRAMREMHDLETNLRHSKHGGYDKGVVYNPDLGIHPKQMSKMYGAGLKMMQKMGYKGGGLGRHGTGVVAPIEVKARRQERGLQNEGEMDSINRHAIDKIGVELPKRHSLRVTYNDSWRDRGIDEVRTYAEVNDDTIAIELDILINEITDKVLWYDELARNNFYEMQKAEQHMLEVESDISTLEVSIKKQEDLLSQCEEACIRIKGDCAICDNNLNSFNGFRDEQHCYAELERLFNVFSEVWKSNVEVYATLHIDEVAVSYAGRCLDIIFADWNVEYECCREVNLLKLIKEFFSDRSVDCGIYFHLERVLESPLFEFFSKIWQVVDTDLGWRCYSAWRSAILPFEKTDRSITEKLRQTIIDRLLECIYNGERVHVVHIIVHPWLPIFSDDDMQRLMSTYAKMVKEMLSKDAIHNMHKCQQVLNSWKVLMDPHMLDTLTTHLCTCLLLALKEVDINPRCQDTRVVEAVVLWHEYLGVDPIADAFCKEFMPRWLNVLKGWLRLPSANFDEAIMWYEGWKSLFPKDLLNGSVIESFFKDALREMDSVSRDILNIPAHEGNSSKVQEDVAPSMSMLQKLEALGASCGLTIIERHGLTCDGKQVYAFGFASVLFDGDNIMVVENGTAVPITCDDLIKVAQGVN